MFKQRRSRYSEGEVKALIEDYAAYKAAADTTPRGRRLDFLIMLADLGKALQQLPMKEWEAVLLHGLLGIPQAEAANLLRIKQQTLNKRYRQGLEDAHFWINGGEDV